MSKLPVKVCVCLKVCDYSWKNSKKLQVAQIRTHPKSGPLTLLPTVDVRTVCAKAKQKNAKQNNWKRFKGLLAIKKCQDFLEKGKLVVGGTSVTCISVSLLANVYELKYYSKFSSE